MVASFVSSFDSLVVLVLLSPVVLALLSPVVLALLSPVVLALLSPAQTMSLSSFTGSEPCGGTSCPLELTT